ncbi:MAG: CHASE2 domain-containing protein [Desulfurivibrio sp.]|nr:MAG: CHASE2 domain-containing protein [Desulfurivibrio sp.]
MKSPGRPSRWQGVVLLSGFLVTLLFSLASISQPHFLSLVGLKVYDSMVRSLPRGEPGSRPVIVDLDEKSLAAFGQWPWPRYRVALLLDKLRQMGARAVGLDIIFAEADRTSLHILQQELERDLHVKLSLAGLPRPIPDNDLALAEVLRKGPFVLGYKFSFEKSKVSAKEDLLHPLAVVFRRQSGPAGSDSLFTARDATTDIRVFTEAVAASGFVNYAADADGVLRRVPLLMRYRDRIYPGLALATVMKAWGLKGVTLDIPAGGLAAVLINDRRLPVDPQSRLLLAYQGRGHFFEYLSAADVLNDAVPGERVAGRIVLVGTSAAGLMDSHPTPLDPVYPGVEVHATIIDNIINGHFLARPLWAAGFELAALIGLGCLSTLLLARANALVSVGFLFAGLAGLWYGSFFLLRQQGIFVDPLYGMLLLGVNFAVLSLLKFRREERKVRKRTRELLLAQDTTILSLTALAETRDNETGGHIQRTRHYVRVLAEHLAGHPRFSKHLDNDTIEMFFRSAPLHDIGKVGVADRILLKPGRLSVEEFALMKEHARLGHDTLVKAESLLQDGNNGHSFLRQAREIAYSHHEKWDGTGYPLGLKGDAIPLAGRLMALADVYDALISARCYKPPFSHAEALEIISKGRGSHFDPDVVDAFLAVAESFQLIARRFADDEPGRHAADGSSAAGRAGDGADLAQ